MTDKWKQNEVDIIRITWHLRLRKIKTLWICRVRTVNYCTAVHGIMSGQKMSTMPNYTFMSSAVGHMRFCRNWRLRG